MNLPDQTQVDCPYCGEPTDIHVGVEDIADDLVEDCTVCCRPIVLHVTCDESGTPIVTVKTESE